MTDLARYFEQLTAGIYWALIVVWGLIVGLYAVEYRRLRRFSPLLKTLLIVLFIDAGRTLFESLYFGGWYSSKAHFLDYRVFTLLSRPELFIIPKTLNLIGAVVILLVICRRWLHDMKAEVAKQREIQRLEAFEKAAFDAITDPITVVDRDYHILMANDATAQLYGVPHQALVGSKCTETLHGSTELCAQCPVTRAFETGELAFAEIEAHSLGEVLAVWAYPLNDAQGNTYGALKYVKVVTEERQLEAQRQAVEEFRNELISLASHEIRGPLTTIRGYAETIARGVNNHRPGEFLEFVEIIDQESQRLEGLVRDLLDMSQLEEGKLRLDPGPCELAPLCEEAAARLIAPSEAHQADLRLPEDLPPLAAEADRVRQILFNLVSNAIKYSPAGGVVTLAAETRPGFVRFSVSDQGLGVPPEDRERLFQRFYRVRTAETAEIDGSGLGLYITRAIVEGYGGRIWVESGADHGTTFQVELPAHEPKAVAAEPRAPEEEHIAAYPQPNGCCRDASG